MLTIDYNSMLTQNSEHTLGHFFQLLFFSVFPLLFSHFLFVVRKNYILS